MVLDGQATYITKAGLKKLEDELHELKNVRRREIAERIQQAKELGDLSENAEYSEAKEEQAWTEGRVIEIENLLRNAVIVTKEKDTDTVSIGSTIEVTTNGDTMTYSIVGANESEPAAGKISNESPLGKAFLGKKKGEDVEVTTPGGTKKFTVTKIS